jgi:hypothetical protein
MQNPIVALPSIPGEELDTLAGTPPPRYNQATFADVGRALLVSFLDLRGINPASRLPSTPFRTIKGLNTWLMKQMVGEALDYQRRQAALKNGTPVSTVTVEAALPPPSVIDTTEWPNCMTIKCTRTLPPTTIYDVSILVEKLRDMQSAAAGPSHVAGNGLNVPTARSSLPHGTLSTARKSPLSCSAVSSALVASKRASFARK